MKSSAIFTKISWRFWRIINGITILNKEVCNEGSTVAHILFALMFIISALIVVYIIIDSIRNDFYVELFFLILVMPFCVATFFATIESPEGANDTYTKYEVTISDEVPMKEFTDKYSIIEQRGDIYVIKEKENGWMDKCKR